MLKLGIIWLPAMLSSIITRSAMVLVFACGLCVYVHTKLFFFSFYRKRAFSAIQQAARLKPTSWKMWENYLTLALKAKEFSSAMQAMKKVRIKNLLEEK